MYDVVYGSAQYASEDRQMINVTIVVNGEQMPFTASPNDPDPSGIGRQIYVNAVFGEYGEVAPYVPFDPIPAPADPIEELNSKIAALELRVAALEEK